MENTQNTDTRYHRFNEHDSHVAANKHIPHFVIALLSAAAVLLSSVLPLAAANSKYADMLAWGSCIAVGIICIFISRKLSSVILLALAYTLILPYASSPVPIAIAVGALTVCGIYSALTASAKAIQLPLLISAPIITYIIALLITRDAYISSLSVIAFPPALAMGLSSRLKKSRSFSIAAFAAVALCELALFSLVHILLQNRTISHQILENAIVYTRNSIAWGLKNAVVSAGNIPLGEDIIIQVNALSNEIINALAGVTVASALIIGFASQKIQHSVFERFELESLQNESGVQMTASLPAAIIFASAHVLSYTSSSTHAPSFLASAALNISLILMPLLLYVGFSALAALPKKIGILAIAAWIGVAILSAFMSSSMLSIIALIGAFYIFFVSTDSWAKTHYSKGEDQ